MALVVDADVGVFVAAVGVRHRGQDERRRVPVQPGQRPAEIYRHPIRQGRREPQDPLFAAGERGEVVVVDS